MMQFILVGDRELVARFAHVEGDVRRRLSEVLFNAMVEATRIVQQNKLSGQVLHRRSGHLSNSVIHSPLGYEEGGNLVGFFGVPEGPTAVYGYVHEYGGTFQIPAHLRRNPGGKAAKLTPPALLSPRRTAQAERGALPGYSMVQGHSATYPERSYIRSTFQEIRAKLQADLQQAVVEGLGA